VGQGPELKTGARKARDELWLAGGRREEPRETMRIAAKPLEAYPWYLRPFFWNQRRKYGRVLDSALLWVRSPKLFLAVALLYGAIDRKGSPIEPALRSLLTVRVSQINHCRFCIDLNSATLLKRGISRDKLWALEDWRRSNLFVERERAALDYAEAITRLDLEVDDALMARLRGHFDEDAIVELTALIAFQNMSSKFNAALDVPPQGFCRLPEARREGQKRPELTPTPGC
jgi:AhpD family alkylhydroperoxidase